MMPSAAAAVEAMAAEGPRSEGSRTPTNQLRRKSAPHAARGSGEHRWYCCEFPACAGAGLLPRGAMSCAPGGACSQMSCQPDHEAGVWSWAPTTRSLDCRPGPMLPWRPCFTTLLPGVYSCGLWHRISPWHLCLQASRGRTCRTLNPHPSSLNLTLAPLTAGESWEELPHPASMPNPETDSSAAAQMEAAVADAKWRVRSGLVQCQRCGLLRCHCRSEDSVHRLDRVCCCLRGCSVTVPRQCSRRMCSSTARCLSRPSAADHSRAARLQVVSLPAMARLQAALQPQAAAAQAVLAPRGHRLPCRAAHSQHTSSRRRRAANSRWDVAAVLTQSGCRATRVQLLDKVHY
jgi:hypothetical protein